MYDRLLTLCKQKQLTITALCTAVTGSPGNLATWKKGYMRSDYLLKASQLLECSTDFLLTGKNPDVSELSEDAKQLLSDYELLTDSQKQAVREHAASLAELSKYREADAMAKEDVS